MTIVETMPLQQIDLYIEMAENLIREGRLKQAQEIIEGVSEEEAEEIILLAQGRIKNKREDKTELAYALPDDLRFATNRFVAEHRAKRLACNHLVEIGCGIGSQTLAFARQCAKVTAIDTDGKRVAFARANATRTGITNVDFVVGDGIAALKELADVDVVFCDPERAAEEGTRSLSTLKPAPKELIAICSNLTDNIAIELPPQIKDKESLDAEYEYVSVGGQLNRLTAYLGGLKKAARSAVVLPSEDIVSSSVPPVQLEETNMGEMSSYQYLAEVDGAVLAAGLTREAFGSVKGVKGLPGFIALEKEITSPFVRNQYEVLAHCLFSDAKKILHDLKAKKVILRGIINKDKYWAVRNDIERGLHGTKTLTLFMIGRECVVAKEAVD